MKKVLIALAVAALIVAAASNAGVVGAIHDGLVWVFNRIV